MSEADDFVRSKESEVVSLVSQLTRKAEALMAEAERVVSESAATGNGPAAEALSHLRDERAEIQSRSCSPELSSLAAAASAAWGSAQALRTEALAALQVPSTSLRW